MRQTIRAWGRRALVRVPMVCVILLATLSSTHSSSRGESEYFPTTVSPSVDVTATTAVTPSVKRRTPMKRPTSSVLCLAQNLYFEAGTEPAAGIAAVAATVFNRMASKKYPQSICAVVYQPFQYSWTLNTSRWNKTPPQMFITLAQKFIRDRDILQEDYPVTHFHRVDILPKWAPTLTYVSTFGQHIFYRM